MKKVGLAVLIFLISFSVPAETSSTPDIATLIERIETRRGTWIGFRSEVSLQFMAPEGQKGTCKGNLLYHRLDEKILLSCFNEKNKPVFYFKTDDSKFQLYLIPHQTVYQGSIFELQSSPAIQSHLQPLDLYRALKPQVLVPSETSLGEEAEDKIVLRVKKDGKTARQLQMTAEGDVVREIYFNEEEKPSVEIQRADLEEVKGTEPAAAFPRRILIESSKQTRTEIEINSAQFLPEVSDSELEIPFPDNIRKLNL